MNIRIKKLKKNIQNKLHKQHKNILSEKIQSKKEITS